MNFLKNLFKKKAKCSCCGKTVVALGHTSEIRAGSLGSVMGSIPEIKGNNAFMCEKCNSIFCPVCSGNKAGNMNLNDFICTHCNHYPVERIFR